MQIEPNLVTISRRLRKAQTPWEKKLWMYLKGRKFGGFKFRGQYVLGKFVFDFCCFEKKLLIELDGSQHKESIERKNDLIKTGFAHGLGYKVLRFNNNDIDSNIEGVLEIIKKGLINDTSSVTRLRS